jgi:hypothetical protein
VKIRPTDSEKIVLAEEIIEEYVDIGRVLEKLKK